MDTVRPSAATVFCTVWPARTVLEYVPSPANGPADVGAIRPSGWKGEFTKRQVTCSPAWTVIATDRFARSTTSAVVHVIDRSGAAEFASG